MVMVEVSDRRDMVKKFFDELGYELFDMRTLSRIDEPAFNTLALHRQRHRFLE